MYDLCAGTAGASLRLGVFHYEARSKEEERKNEKYSDKIEFFRELGERCRSDIFTNLIQKFFF